MDTKDFLLQQSVQDVVFRNTPTRTVGISWDGLNRLIFPKRSLAPVGSSSNWGHCSHSSAGRFSAQLCLRVAPGLFPILWGKMQLYSRCACRHFPYTRGLFCFIIRLFLQFHHNFRPEQTLNNFFQKIIGDTLTIRLNTGNNFTIIFSRCIDFYYITSPAHYTSLWVIDSASAHYIIPTGSVD